MLRLRGEQMETLWDAVLPAEMLALPPDLARLDALCDDGELLGPFRSLWLERWPEALGQGRPTVPMETFVRLMLVKHRYGWGYETLLREVSDSISLRRFCRIALARSVPDESTIRKLVRRLGEEPICEISRLVIAKATRETRFRGRAVRIDSTVIEADVRYPTDSGLALDGARALARETRTLGEAGVAAPIADRSRAIGRRLRSLGRALRRRTGDAKVEVLRLTGECGALLEKSIAQARAASEAARRGARGRGARGKLAAARRVGEVAARAERVATQIRQRVAGERIPDRLVSLADADARPIRKGKLGNPTQFGYVAQLAEVCPASGRGQRGFLMPVTITIGNPSENELLPNTISELANAGLAPPIAALDGGFQSRATIEAFEPIAPRQIFIAGRKNAASHTTRRRLARFRTGCEGRISHLKRAYALGRSRLRGLAGVNTHTNWAILAYNADTYRRYATT
ncbi:MAG: transposase [Actinomycetota bacterium]|nr:transposase [Actinomycetota bacterium]